MQIIQKPLKEVYEMFLVHNHKKPQAENPGENNKVVFI